MRPEPFVSIITPTRDRPNLLREAWVSLTHQTRQDFEFIISVNGKDASSLGEAYRIRDEDNATASQLGQEGRVKVIYDPKSNYYQALHSALKAARGNLIHFLSDDDLLEPEFLETCYAYLTMESDLDMLGVDYRALVEPSKMIQAMPCMLDNPKPKAARIGTPALGAYVLNTTVFKNSLLERLKVGEGPFDPSFRILGDEDFFIRLAKTNTKAMHVCAPLVQYRVHPQQVTQRQEVRHFFEGLRIRRAMDLPDSPREIASRVAWSANRMTGFLGTKVRRKMGAKVSHAVMEIDRLRYPELRSGK